MDWSDDLGGMRIRFSRDIDSPADIIVEFDIRARELLSEKPRLKIEFVTQRLKRKWQGLVLRGGNRDKKTAFNGELPIDTFRQTFELKNTPFFDFSGEEIESFCVAKLYNRGSTGEKRVPNPFPLSRSQKQDTAEIMQPKDVFDRSQNWAQLPHEIKKEAIQKSLLSGCIFVAVLVWGISIEIWTWMRFDDLPLLFWLMTLGSFFWGVFFYRTRALQDYIDIDKSKTIRLSPRPKRRYSWSDIVSGTTKIDLNAATFRIVCCNRERYRYLQSVGQTSVWVNRSHDFNSLLLHETRVGLISADSTLTDYLPKGEEISFDAMFANLYPQAMVSEGYGISIYWEVQIIHDKLVDVEIPVPGVDKNWPFEYFFQN